MKGYEKMSTKINATKNIKSSKTRKTTNKNDKYISPKNYIYAFLILVGGIVLTLYIFEWYQVKQEEKLMTSYLISSNTIESNITDIESLEQITQEAPSSYFIYIGYTGDEDVYNLEKELKRVIDKYKLNDEFYYLDITDLKNKNQDYLKEINSKLDVNLENIPAIIYVNEGKILDSNVLDGVNDTKLKVSDFEQLLDIYEFEIIK
ncbi:MAG: hypothetical protein IJY87_05200 [Bacilli bacterium]|nr:hypothetical protein [Bacilli bacterium]